MDLIPLKTRSIGGNTQILLTVDEKSGSLKGTPIISKHTKSLQDGIKSVIEYYNSRGHCICQITCDDENALLSLKAFLSTLEIMLSSTPADLHEKRIERFVQTLKSRKRAVIAAFLYELSDKLESEAHMYTIAMMNRLPNKTSRNMSPHQLVTRIRPK